MASFTVRACGSFAAVATEPARDLHALFEQAGIACPRRTNRFTKLTLLGAQRCAGQLPALPPESSIYLATGQGNVADTAMLMQQLERDRLEPEPIPFINVSSNMAGYYIANRFGLAGRNLVLSRHTGAWECALELACLDLALGKTPLALVGAVDECAWPLAQHRRRLGVDADTVLVENSAWLALSAAPADTAFAPPGYRHFDSRAALLSAAVPGEAGVSWTHGTEMEDAVVAALSERLGAAPVAGALAGTSPTMSAVVLAQALQSRIAGRLEYVNGDGHGGYYWFGFTIAR